MVKTDADVAMFYAWYCGRFAGVCQMLRQPAVYKDRDALIEQLLCIAADYEQERERRRIRECEGLTLRLPDEAQEFNSSRRIVMKAEELQVMIEGQLSKLAGLEWRLHNDNEVKAFDNGYMYYLRTDGRMQVLRGGTFLLDWQSDVFTPLAERLIVQAKELELNALAELYK